MSILLRLLSKEGYRPAAVSVGQHNQKLQAAKEWLGERWVLHPAYVYNERHRIYK